MDQICKRLPVIVHERQFATEVLDNDGLVLVGFWADWSGACHLMAPIVESIARERQMRIKVVLVDIDQTPRLTARYGVASVPTFLFFRRGQLVEQVLGTVPKKALEQRVVLLAKKV